ncbi:MAG TPA: hypothetical protein VGF74_05465 [Thermoleophilaceae bacterium]
MRKERKGPLGKVAGIAEDLAAGQRRRQQSQKPRVAIYDSAGHAKVLAEDAPGRAELLELAEEMTSLVAGG